MFKGFLLGAMIAMLSMLAGQAQAAEVYDLDKAHSSIDFSVSHLMVSKTNGSFNEFTGELEFDKDDLANSRLDVVISVPSIDTRNEKRDEHLRSADFFDAQEYPEINFTTKSIIDKGEGLYDVVGDLTMKAVTKEVTIPIKVLGPVDNPMGGTALGIEASFHVDRQDYGVSWNKVLDNGGVMVGDDVKVSVNLELHKKS